MGLPALQGDYLPHGRWACSPAEVEAAFVAGRGPERAAIWRDWLKALSLLKQLVGTVPAAWLSGSFLSSKLVPGDIDSVFVVEAADLQAVRQRPQDWSIVELLAGGNGAKDSLGLNVDSYILRWCPSSGANPEPGTDYYALRGYWDDLWVRAKDSDARRESIPRRGYVEVMIDGYK
ncbi:DUF6932 family protein [Flexivirga oryzae]|uniref:Uncharacterized protein n=1 Tax=Flexivirga oryzae TaxID=1794944 RepID=A0A839NB27_9MICO|nr:hypothetical protein [Flexivirga oryzae]MBB2893433.1 hypothetical protein [Flexivirga oryzae]